ncbi:MAG: type and secretion system protein, partial [Verrucomicrobiaceae bacterium]|nr:type and secretion system protein [Verrucomicrobiaceae bacterium]
EALRGDPYNTAARRGMERVEQRKSQYMQSARDHRRAAMIDQVDATWEQQVPAKIVQVTVETGETSKNASMYLFQKMKSIRFPHVSFNGATIDEAVEYLRVKSRDLDNTADPTQRGVNIILKGGDAPSTAQISLDLKDVPMEEALRYITELAGMKFKVEPFAVLVIPVTENNQEMVTRVYKVPADFLTIAEGGADNAAPATAAADPFATKPAADTGGSRMLSKKTAVRVLTDNGIPFPEGASAVFNPISSQLVVRNTTANLDMVESYVDSIANKTPKQVYITTKFVEVSQKNTSELGFDWLLGSFNLPGTNRTFGTGGTVGNSTNGPIVDADGNTPFPFTAPGPGGTPIGGSPVSRGLRFGTAAITPNSVDSLLAPRAQAGVTPGTFAVSGVLTDPQFQVVVRALDQKKGVDLMSAPSVTTKSGVPAKIEVVREFLYPTEFDPPQIPQNFSGGNAGTSILGAAGGGTNGSFPVTPTTPTSFQARNVGVSMSVEPTVGPDGYTIDLVMSPEVTEFEGFINYGTPIVTTSTDALGNPSTITLTENRIPQPVFSTRRVNTSVTVWDGQTVAMGGLLREDVQSVNDKVPLLGDLPFIGRLFQTKAEDHFKHNLMVFVTAKLLDPSGQAVRQQAPAVVVEESTVDSIRAAPLGGGLLPAPQIPAANP